MKLLDEEKSYGLEIVLDGKTWRVLFNREGRVGGQCTLQSAENHFTDTFPQEVLQTELDH